VARPFQGREIGYRTTIVVGSENALLPHAFRARRRTE
jgi:hypothetical protein